MRPYGSILDLRVVDFPIISSNIYKSVRQKHHLLIRFLQFPGVSHVFEIYSFSSLSLRSFQLPPPFLFSILILILSVQSRFRYAIKSRWLSDLSRAHCTPLPFFCPNPGGSFINYEI